MNATLKFDRPATITETRKKRTTERSEAGSSQRFTTHKDTYAARAETLRRKEIRRDKYTAR